jgi:hypothetical protein
MCPPIEKGLLEVTCPVIITGCRYIEGLGDEVTVTVDVYRVIFTSTMPWLD